MRELFALEDILIFNYGVTEYTEKSLFYKTRREVVRESGWYCFTTVYTKNSSPLGARLGEGISYYLPQLLAAVRAELGAHGLRAALGAMRQQRLDFHLFTAVWAEFRAVRLGAAFRAG